MSKRWLVASIFLSSAFVDAPSYIGAGAISAMGILTVVYTLWIALILVCKPRPAWRMFLQIYPISALLLFSILQCFWHPLSVQGAQNICLLWIFVGLIALVSLDERGVPECTVIGRMLDRATIFASSCYFLILLYDGFGAEGIGAISFIAARSFALFALLGLALLLGRWAHGSRVSFWLAVGLMFLIALSLSRTALVIGAFLFPLARLRSLTFRDLRRFVIIAGIAVIGLYSFVVSVEALRARFLGRDTIQDYVSGEASIDTSGRLTAWMITLDSYGDAPWFGKGPGTANDLIGKALSELDLGHPLNEYLRFLHDEGIVGLTLLLVGSVQLLLLCHRAYRESVDASSPASSFHLGTFLALVAVLLSMITDNTASYIYVMGPLGIFVGTSVRSLKKSGLRTGARRMKLDSLLPSASSAVFPSGLQT